MLVHSYLTSSIRLLKSYLIKDFPDCKTIESTLFLHLRETSPHLPDYIHREDIEAASLNTAKLSSILLSGFNALVTPLEMRNSEVRVIKDSFSEWQETLTRVTPLPLIAARLRQEKPLFEDRINIFKKVLCKSTLPSPYHPDLEAMIRHEGLSELHIHINGTTEADIVWLDALQSPQKVYSYMKTVATNPEVIEQYRQLDDKLDYKNLYRLFRLARGLREELFNACNTQRMLPISRLEELIDNPLTTTSSKHPLHEYVFADNLLVLEGLFISLCLDRLENVGDDGFSHGFLLYLLILNHFNRLLVQQADQYGFDQFQKITFNQLREHTEEQYIKRFQQLEGMYGEDLRFLEARIAPKPNAAKMLKLLKTIISDYELYAYGLTSRPALSKEITVPKYKRMDMAITAHFVKAKDKPKNIHPCRFYDLRQLTLKRQNALLAVWRKYRKVRQYLHGIDVAANELHTPPEVFAPLFKRMRKEGFVHFTYHGGEDFIHLLSGIRTVYEAAYYLDLRSGDRIGHATAVGIFPTLWRERIGKTIRLTKGEWLDDMIFSYYLLSQEENTAQYLHIISYEIQRYGQEIFDTNDFTLENYVEFWKEKGQDPLDEQFPIEGSRYCKKLLHLYHHADVYERARVKIEVPTSFFHDEIYTKLQEATIRYLNQKQIIIESMPTSNVRISFYKNHNEHHIFRWLGLEKDEKALKELPTIVLCSDDPGIFANNLRIDFTHVHRVMTDHFNLSPDQAMEKIKKLNENGRTYSFTA
ncbi:MAG: hypothetical protein M0P91_14000 [Sulfuricurvum sp.]|uniref:hypothetical protein n=1 Tax=Sulfuricurvum sp. TaxID=2025608 RepID=UPI0025FECF77|nr:hypothetical protein [Sulfuricurvum sp.]MCK9374290.1 hypothetical protein [Sulfuricurvum sp.]